jgi:exopolysaccharide production protein ExoZ
MRPSDTTVRIESLQWLRALAAMMVLIGHVLEEAAHYRGIGAGAAALPWTRGVDVFFVISGVVIALAGQRHAGSTSGAGAFLVRRVIRVVPLYWMFTTLMVAALVVAPGGVKETELDPGQIAASYLFLPYERHDGRIAPVLSLGWTLNYEMFFYLLAAVALAWRWPRAAGILTGLLLALALAGWLFAPETTAARFWTGSILLEFGFGVLIALWWQRHGHRHRPKIAGVLFLSGVAALVLLHGSGLPRFLGAGLPAGMMVAGPVLFLSRGGGAAGRIGVALGDASYALYLSHRFVLRLATLALLPLMPATGTGLWLFVALVTLTATGLSLLVFRHIERPVLALLNRRLAPVAA